jgi:hypothetical protein
MSGWLRLYTDILTDADVLSLECRHFRTWVLSLLSAKNNHRQPGAIPDLKQWALDVKLRQDVAEQHLNVLINAGLIDRMETGYRLHNWDNWQYKSDDVTSRVNDWRKRKRNVARNVACNNHVTDQSTDTEYRYRTTPLPPSSATLPTDHRLAIDLIYGRHPKKAGRMLYEQELAGKLGESVNPDALMAKITEAHAIWCESEDWTKDGGKYCPKLSNWIRDAGYDDWPPGYDPEYEARIARERKESYEATQKWRAENPDDGPSIFAGVPG